jgi:site-specific DNA recombinase
VRAYAEAKALDLVEVLTDEAQSGQRWDRNGLQELIRRCESGDVGHVVVWRLDRLTRRTRHLLTLVEDLFLKRHIELHSVSESLDTSTPHGRFVLTLFGGLAQMERELISDRTRSALAYKRAQYQPTSHAPLGFRSNGSKARMEPVPQELGVVHRILRERRNGGSYASISRGLNVDRVPTKRGGCWHASTVRGIVMRRGFYATAQPSI